MSNIGTLRISSNFRLTNGKVLVRDLEFGVMKKGSIYIPDDDMETRGIRPRWAQVYKVADDIEQVEEGDYVLLKHARWTRKMPFVIDEERVDLWMIDYPDAVLVKSKKKPTALDEVQKTF